MPTTIQVRRGTAAQWTAANPTLASGEPGFETDTNKVKVGDGATAWNSLAYFGNSGTVTSVAMTAPSILSVAGSPVTTTGTLALTLATQSANTVFSGPTSGSAAAPTFRALVAADLPIGGGGGVFGDGSDGAVTFDGASTVLGLTPGSSTYTFNKDIYCTDITVDTGVTLYTNGWRIFATGTLTVSGTGVIRNDMGQDGGSGTAGAAGTAGASNGTQSWGQTSWGGGGGAGQRRTTAGATNGGAGTAGTAPNLPAAGGAGGSSTGGTAGTGGSGGTVTAPVAAQGYPRFAPDAVWGWRYRVPTGAAFAWAGGSGGGGGSVSSSAVSTSCASGGGGGAGGLVFVAAKDIVLSGSLGSRIRSHGGNGGDGHITAASGNHGAGGGGGGSGGVVIVIYRSITNSSKVTATGGTGGTGASYGTGVGSNGSNGGDGVVYLIPV